MIHFDHPKQKSSIIKVLGIGGGGSNAVNFMHTQHIEGVDFIICNTDAKAIEQSNVLNKIQLGPHLTQGLGAGANPEVGKAATEESLQEIKSILEVNTKMVFITSGMGGGTGTGGAPIVAKVCKELGILTVGIVTTPFGFEGPKRMLQAEEGIRQLKPYVDTLLVISNDKLRMQYGNLKMKEAFSKADNVLATAAKCITDIINSRGHIIVDFADVCTVMKNGGVAILGKAEEEGENRAIKAIENALSSPLLNDNEIKGAKWILININSSDGDDECTMDEVEIINNYLRMQAGENTDVIVGMGYDNTLEKKIGITLIATGFDSKDPFAKPVETKKIEKADEKIVMTLQVEGEEPKNDLQLSVDTNHDLIAEPVVDPMEPTMSIIDIVDHNAIVAVKPTSSHGDSEEIVHFELDITATEGFMPKAEAGSDDSLSKENGERQTLKMSGNTNFQKEEHNFLSKPLNIYEEQKESGSKIMDVKNNEPQLELHFVENIQPESSKEEIIKEIQAAPVEMTKQKEEISDIDIALAEEQRKKQIERIQKLRSLSYNMNSNDPNNEYDTVPAYIRKNLDVLGNTLASVENFYSKYTVNKDENNNTHISTINKFMEGKNPD